MRYHSGGGGGVCFRCGIPVATKVWHERWSVWKWGLVVGGLCTCMVEPCISNWFVEGIKIRYAILFVVLYGCETWQIT